MDVFSATSGTDISFCQHLGNFAREYASSEQVEHGILSLRPIPSTVSHTNAMLRRADLDIGLTHIEL